MLCLIFAIPKANAWGPITHVYYTNESLKQVTGTVGTLGYYVKNYHNWFLCGLVYPDVTVIYYYTQWISYSSTHAWHFQRTLWNDAVSKNSPEAMAFAIGVGTHLLQDCVAHNLWVPTKITGTLVQNNIIHPLSEGLLETDLATDDLARVGAQTSFNYWNQPFPSTQNVWYRAELGRNLNPVEWSDEILGKFNFTDEAQLFHTILSEEKFYIKAYVIPGEGLWAIYKGISECIRPFVNIADSKRYINETIAITVDWWEHGNGEDAKDYAFYKDPTGYEALKSADTYVMMWTIVIVVGIVMTLLVYKKYIKK